MQFVVWDEKAGAFEIKSVRFQLEFIYWSERKKWIFGSTNFCSLATILEFQLTAHESRMGVQLDVRTLIHIEVNPF